MKIKKGKRIRVKFGVFYESENWFGGGKKLVGEERPVTETEGSVGGEVGFMCKQALLGYCSLALPSVVTV